MLLNKEGVIIWLHNPRFATYGLSESDHIGEHFSTLSAAAPCAAAPCAAFAANFIIATKGRVCGYSCPSSFGDPMDIVLIPSGLHVLVISIPRRVNGVIKRYSVVDA